MSAGRLYSGKCRLFVCHANSRNNPLSGVRQTHVRRYAMKSSNELRTMLRSIDHKSYPAYKSLAGIYRFPGFQLSIDHVQGDPFASPSHLSVYKESPLRPRLLFIWKSRGNCPDFLKKCGIRNANALRCRIT